MKYFDRKCPSCGTITIDSLEPSDAPVILCLQCGEPTERAWIAKAATVIGDECDFTSRNGEREPIRFRSKLEHRRWLKEKGYRINDAHVGTQDGDTSKHSSRWAAMDAQTLQNAIDLVTRAASAPAAPSTPDGPQGITSDEGVIRYLGVQARIARGEYL